MLARLSTSIQTNITLFYVKFACDKSISEAAGLASHEVHINRPFRVLLSLFYRRNVCGRQRFDQDQLALKPCSRPSTPR